MAKWTLLDDGTLDTVIVCNTCKREYRFTPVDVEDASDPEAWMRECVVGAHMQHEETDCVDA